MGIDRHDQDPATGICRKCSKNRGECDLDPVCIAVRTQLLNRMYGRNPAVVSAGPDKRPLPDRARMLDDQAMGIAPDPDMLQEVPFTYQERANLIRIAKAIESLNEVFRTTAKIEITNTAVNILEGLVSQLRRQNELLERLAANLEKMQTENTTSTAAKPKKHKMITPGAFRGGLSRQ